jgi:Fe-S cluster assembly scaffold protein SufB
MSESEWRELTSILPVVGADVQVLDDPHIGHVVASGHRVLSTRQVPGVMMDLQETKEALIGHMTIAKGAVLQTPVHLCFGLVQPSGRQRIQMTVTVEAEATAAVLAHCLFPFAEDASHVMDAVFDIGPGASLRYLEGHYHGPRGGMTVSPTAHVTLHAGARYFSDFTLTSGRVGTLRIDYAVEAAEDTVTELTAKAFAHAQDHIAITESVKLMGARARGLIKTRLALEDQASAEVTGITEAYAAGARGHVDCMEIVKDQARASAVPIVRVFHPLAKVTHEAAIGSVDKKELETLMAHGLTPEQAVEMIVSGILR